jgi:hypothetical protein
MTVDLTVRRIDSETGHALVEAPDGFVVKLPELPEGVTVGETIGVDDALWQKWRESWSLTNPEWFEMKDLKKHTYNNKVWIPLYTQHKISETGDIRHEGFREEYFGAHSVIVPTDQRDQALNLEWMDVSGSSHKPWVDDENIFHSAAEHDWKVQGSNPVLVHRIEIERSTDLHINQDLVLALSLKRDGDVWTCPEEDYVEVIRLKRDKEGTPIVAEIRAEFLKDYLCATRSGLILLTYQSRQATNESFALLRWENEVIEKTDSYNWSGRLLPIYEGDFLFDGPVAVFHSGRTDTNYSEDIPVYGFPTDDNTYSTSWTVEPTGRKLVRAISEIWSKEWIGPASKSPRVRGDKVPSKIEFIVDNQGTTETSEILISPSRWLWFHPNVINDLLKKRTGVLSWYTEDTGGVGGAWNRAVHFGVNSIGLVNVYAKDIGQLRDIDKRIWARHNLSPEGRVSAELLMSQMQAQPAETVAPEQTFFALIDDIQQTSKDKLGRELLRKHSSEEEILRKIHRFQASSLEGFYLRCKEITRFLIERIDIDSLKKLKKEENTNLGSLRRIENILTTLGADGRTIMKVPAGVYDLRIADAHLSSTDSIQGSMKLVGVDYEETKLHSGKKLIENINGSLAQIREVFDNGDLTKLTIGSE